MCVCLCALMYACACACMHGYAYVPYDILIAYIYDFYFVTRLSMVFRSHHIHYTGQALL